MLLPKKTKYRKVRKGRNNGRATRGNTVAFGDWGLMSLDNERINSRQIESVNHLMLKWVVVKVTQNTSQLKLKLAP